MLLPLMGFFLALFAIGGLGSLVAMADPTRASLFPFTMAMLFSGLGVWVLLFGLGALTQLIDEDVADTLPFLGIPLGAIGGAFLWFCYRRSAQPKTWN